MICDNISDLNVVSKWYFWGKAIILIIKLYHYAQSRIILTNQTKIHHNAFHTYYMTSINNMLPYKKSYIVCYFEDSITLCCITLFQYLIILYIHEVNNIILGTPPLQHLTAEITYVSNDFNFQEIKINYGSNKETEA